jgi:hypothetical protein
MKLGKMLLLASFLGTFAECMLLPLWSTFTDKCGGSILDAGIGYAGFCIATGLVVMFVGSTKFYARNAKWMLLWGFAIAGIGDLLYLCVSNKYELFAVQALIGIALGVANPAWDSLFCDDESDDKSSAGRWSFWTGGVSFVSGLSALFGATIVRYYGFNTMFILMFCFDCVSVAYCYRIATRTEVPNEKA